MNKNLIFLGMIALFFSGCRELIRFSPNQKCFIACNPGTPQPQHPTQQQVSLSTSDVTFNSAASNWNDFFRSSNNQACIGSELDCVHGGELKQIKLTGINTCSNLRVEDDLTAFDWTCVESSGNVSFNGKIKAGKGLGQLIEASTLSWKGNFVRVFLNEALAFQSSSSIWWTNPIQPLPNSSTSIVTLNSPSTIYVATSSGISKGYHISAPKISILIPQDISIKGDTPNNFNFASYSLASPNQSSIIVVEKQPFCSVEGANTWTFGDMSSTQWNIDGDGKVMNLIASRDSNYFRIKNINLANSVQHTVLPVGSFGMKNSNINLKGSHFFGIREQDVRSAEYKNINIYGCANTGFVSFANHDSSFSNLFFSGDLHGFATGEAVNSLVQNIVAKNVTSIATSMRSSTGGKYSNFDVKDSGYGLYLYGTTSSNSFTQMNFTNNQSSAIYSEGVMNGSNFDKISAINNGFGGTGDDDSIFEDVTNTSGNIYRNITSSNNKGNGLTISSKGTVLQNILSVNNGADGIKIKAAVKSLVLATIMNNSGNGINQDFSDAGTAYQQVVSVNNGQDGFHFKSETLGATMSQIVSSNNGSYGIFLGDTTANTKIKLGGQLVVSENTLGSCRLSSGGVLGIANSTCMGNAPSSVVVRAPAVIPSFFGFVPVPVSVLSSFVGPLPSSDDTRKLKSSINNWIVDSNTFRVWGKDAGGRGPCLATEYCRINDFSLSLSDVTLRNMSGNPTVQNDYFGPNSICPSAVDGSLNHTTFNESLTYLLNAVEDQSSGTVNRNGLCESGENCLYAPNFGAYQGEGEITECWFSSQHGLENINIKGYSTNGRI
jgi:hypothetical protein